MVFLKRFPVILLFLYAESFQHNLAFLSKYEYNPSPSTSRRWSIEDSISSKETDAAAAGPSSEEETIADIVEENTIGEGRNGDTSVIKNGYTMNSNVNGYSMTSGYSPFLDQEPSPRWLRKMIVKESESSRDDMDEDGYAEMQRGRNQSLLKRIVKFPLKAAKKVVSRDTKEPGTLILVRHGESSWNRNKTFTGWSDPDLTDQGKREMEHAARLLMEGGYHYDINVVFTSRLKRAIRSTWILLQEFNRVYLPVFKSWRLNERFYGALTGLNKTQTAERLGEEVVQGWRGSLRIRPPALTENDPFYPGRDRKYADLTKDQLPLTESLLDCMERTKPLWDDKILFELRKGRNVLVVAHANTIRGLVKTIDDIGEDEIQDVAIPTGIPIVYKFEKLAGGQMVPVPPKSEENSVSQIHMKGKFLEKPGLLKEALKLEGNWREQVPGYDDTMSRHTRPMTGLERSLYKLNAVRELGEWATEFIDLDAIEEDDGNDGNGIFFTTETNKSSTITELNLKMSSRTDNIDDEDVDAIPTFFAQPCITSASTSNIAKRQDSVIVIIRHGKTQHNKLGLFTGWEDAPLADEGIEEAIAAGRNLKKHGFEFDVVYTSWLSRALETAWLVLDELDSLWLPIVKTWRLNERMYGELTGLSKQMVKQRHGEKQFKAWRRGFEVRPPAVSSFSQNYPGNDPRYRYIRDVRYSMKESAIRSIETGKMKFARKLPKTESLKDCMDRTIPYFLERIAKDAVDQNKRVLISSSENAIRGLLMHLCDIPESEITGLEIPNGLPLIYDVKSKCVKLLDDGSGCDPLEVYNFGPSAKYLFRPCQNEDGTLDEECTINFDSLITTNEDQNTLDYIRSKTGR
eukprot:CAMPEP_0168172208 /NCGR_PEP_ID=MMETSP0139_2-20121125/5114_1 /TAXON_ID=44445 /ORGANISM="Pseudo-nitzschia australis, Strain 10249 10 AB" /LENGTH=856 /DNA_ID=CAMNT_0008089809 /DNA_START=94 /DNA_END=2664 /DNA_ORIENTATION=-